MQMLFDVGGRQATGYLAVPVAGKGPGVIVLHAWWGLTPFFMGMCDRLAEQGFVAFAPDQHEGRTAATIDEAKALMESQDQQRTGDVAIAATKLLAEHSAVQGADLGVIGFSMGAAWAIVLSTYAPEHIAGVVLFYGSYAIDFTPARAVFQGHFAVADEWESEEDVRRMESAMREAGREVTLYRYPGTGHWFFEQDRTAYDDNAARLAWERTLTFLREHIG